MDISPSMGVRGINGATETITMSRDDRRRPNVITRRRRRLKNYAIPKGLPYGYINSNVASSDGMRGTI